MLMEFKLLKRFLSSLVAGLSILVAIILFIGGVTAESSHNKKKINNELAFTYYYGASFTLVVMSFVLSELTGVLSVYLYISRHQHSMHLKQNAGGRSTSASAVTLNESVPSASKSLLSNSRNYHSAPRLYSRDRSHEYSPSHSDTMHTYTPGSDSSNQREPSSSLTSPNYSFSRDPQPPRYNATGGPFPHNHHQPMNHYLALRPHAQSMYAINELPDSSLACDHNSRSTQLHNNVGLTVNRREFFAATNRHDPRARPAFGGNGVSEVMNMTSSSGAEIYAKRRQNFVNRATTGSLDCASQRVTPNAHAQQLRTPRDELYTRRTTPV